MATRIGYLTVFSADRSEIYGSFADGTWQIEKTGGGFNHVFSGTATEGTLETFRRINMEAIDHVAFDFESEGTKYAGTAQLLAPQDSGKPGLAKITIESGIQPKQVGPTVRAGEPVGG